MNNPFFNFKSPSPTLSSSHQTHPPLRIADILFDSEDEDSDDLFNRHPLMDLPTYSPRRIGARWLSWLRRTRAKREKDQEIQEEEKGLGDSTVQASCSTNGFTGGDSGSSSSNTGECTGFGSFNLGVGCCLLYLIAASKNELHKMMEMRKQMEAFLVNNREEFLKKDELCTRSAPNDIFAYSAIDSQEAQILPESSTITVCGPPEREECLDEGMDRLEAELEAELECLQLHLDSEKLLNCPKQLRIKVGDGNTASSKSQAMSYGEVIDPQPQEPDSECGVPPNELERRLHELLEARQEEQIRELESALECLQHKLHEKEMEVALWKDTARFISQHATDLSHFASKHEL